MLVVVGAVLGIGYNLVHPHPLPWKGQKMVKVTLDEAAAESHGAAPGTDAVAPEPAEAARGPESGTASAPAETPAPTEDPSPRSEREFKPTDPVMDKVKADAYSDIPESEYPIEIHLDKAKEFYDRGGLLVLDARDLSEYEEGHITGAQSAPTDQMMADLDWMEATAKDPRPIMVYCSGGDCELSMTLGFEIAHTGHRRVLVFEDGYPAWQEAGYPTSTGDKP